MEIPGKRAVRSWKENDLAIRMIALDLDGTTLKGDKSISDANLAAIEEAISRGVVVALATGRVLDSLPEVMKGIKGIKYYICSNGADVRDAVTGETVLKRTVDPGAVKEACEKIKESGYMFESFTGGKAYIGRDRYEDVKKNGCAYRSAAYILETRTPVDDIFGFTLENSESIENINVFFPDQKSKAEFRSVLEEIEGAELTSSFASNYELGPKGAGKGAALSVLLEREGIGKEELLSMGDSPNDISMMELSGISVAVANAEDEVKEAADHTGPANDEDAVSYAIRRFVL